MYSLSDLSASSVSVLPLRRLARRNDGVRRMWSVSQTAMGLDYMAAPLPSFDEDS